MMLGELAASSDVKYHWSGLGCGACRGLDCAGDGALRRECGLGGDVLELSVGGEGTAGGTSRLLNGDFDDRSVAAGGGFGGRDGG